MSAVASSVPTQRPWAPRVLLVDDDPIQRRLSRLQLVSAGFVVETAAGVDEALRRAVAYPPTAILSDVLMGDADGFELCRRVRSMPDLSGVPIVLASAHFGEEADRALAARLGASALVTRTPDFSGEIDALTTALTEGARAPAETSEVAVAEEHLRRTTRQLSALATRVSSSERRYQMLLEHARDAITLVDLDGVIVEANRCCEELLGVEPGGLIGRNIAEYAAPGHEEANLALYRRSLGEGSTHTNAFPSRDRAGRIIFMEWSTTPLEIDGRSLVFSVGRDITPNVRAAEALRQSEERYRSLVERIPYVIWSCDALGGVDFVSANYATTCGFTAEERRADPGLWRDRIHPADRERVLGAFATFIEGGAPYDVEYRWQHKDHHWIRIHDRSSARYEQGGRVRADGVFIDVTRERQLEDELRQAQKMEAMGQLAGGVAHDFNNMLSVILNNATFLSEEMATDDPRREILQEIEHAAERAATLTRQLLSFSRKAVVRPELVCVDRVIADVGKMLTRLIGEDIELSIAAGSAGATVEIDRGQLEHVLLNLAVNARDAMPLGGELTIATSCVEMGDGGAGLAPGHYVAIEARDRGTGIPTDVLPRIFEPFFTTKEPGKGTGLGLSTVYGIVHAASGTVSVASEPGAGATFTILLPVRQGRLRRELPVERISRDGIGTVLLVEDEDMVRAVTRRILESGGYRVIEVRDPVSALALLEGSALQVDLVVSDVVMPGSSGPAMVAELRRSRPSLKALYLSGYSSHPAFAEPREEELVLTVV